MKADFFTIFMSNKMKESYQHAIDYILNIFFDIYPNLTRFRYYKSEIKIIFELMINIIYTKKFKSFFHESFYNLEHDKVKKIYFILYFFENYLLGKLNKKIQTIFKLIDFFFIIRYLFNNSDFYNLSYFISKTKLNFKTNFDNSNWIVDILKNNFLFIFYLLFKFLEWKYNRRLQIENNFSDIIPVHIPEYNTNKIDYCLFCKRKDINEPSFIRTSCYIYCYKCIFNHIKVNKECPQSNLAIETNEINKIYSK